MKSMGWFSRIIGCGLMGLVFVCIAHFLFEVPTSGMRLIFFIGVIGWLIIEYFFPGAENVAIFVFCFLVGAGLAYLFIWPIISGEESATTQIPVSSGPMVREDTNIITQQTIPTQIEYYTRSYHWTYGTHSPTYTIQIPKPLYEYYRQQSHDRNYAKYAITAQDRKVLDRIITSFRENTDSKIEAAYNIVAFVQSLPYFKDDVSTGYDNYPRYPIETLVDNGGDCEDTAILTAALLKEMNYDVVLISPPGHMAVGITCSACTGTSYTYNNKKYYYLETTGNNWKVGQMPEKYKNTKAKVYPI
jgi:hypothetical protein